MSTGDDAPGVFDRLAEEYVARVRAGEAVDVEAYAEAYPAIAADIRKLFPLLAMVEDVKADTVADATGEPTEVLPEEVDGFRVVRELGRGGMGLVLEAERGGERYAIKMIHAHLASRPEFVDRFLREAEVGTRVVHEHVVRTISAGTTPWGAPYLVMEYVEGQNLRDLLEEVGALPERLVRHVGQCVAEALAEIHAAGIIHRDVKPENVVITPDEQVKLMDLGVALVQDEATRLSQTGQFVGSLLYAAPEQIRGKDLDGRTDLYGLGLLLFELATGEHALHVASGGQALPFAAVDAPSPRERNGSLSPFFDELVKSLLALEPDSRPADAATTARILDGGEGASWWRDRARPDQLVAQRLGHDPAERTVAFHGREDELAQIDNALASVRAGLGRVVAIRAGGGIGKSRLVREWLSRADVAGNTQLVVVPHAPEGERFSVPPLARAFADVLGTVSLEEQLRELLGPSKCLATPFARFLLGEQAGEYEVGLPPTVVSTATVRLARGLARREPLVLVLEDLHNASAAARELCIQVARGLGELPALVLLTMRPDSMESTWDAVTAWPHASAIELAALDADASFAVLDDLADEALGSTERSELVRRADGNPLYLLELMRSVTRAGGTVAGASPTSPGEPAAEDGALPDTLRGLLVARLEELSEDERELLELAACFGSEFDPVLVADALEASRMQTLKALGRIERRQGLLEPAGRAYRFSHHLIQETLYGEIHEALRESFHASIARVFAKRAAADGHEPKDVPGPLATTIARHAIKGAELELGLRYAPPAWSWLYDMHDSRTQYDLAQSVLALGDAITPRMRAMATFYAGDAEFEWSSTTQCVERMNEVLALLEETPDPFVQREALIVRAIMHRFQGSYDEAYADFERALALARAAENDVSQAMVLRHLAGLMRQQGKREESMRLVRESLAHAERGGSVLEQCSCMNSIAIRLAEEGRYSEALEHYATALDLARQCGKRLTEASVLNNSGEVLRCLARHDEALERTTEALAIARELANSLVEGRILRIRAGMLHDRGQLTEAYDMIAQIVERLEANDLIEESSVYRIQLGLLDYELGRFDAAEAGLAKSLAHARKAEDLRILGASLMILAEVRSARGEFEEAQGYIDEATSGRKDGARTTTAVLRHLCASRCALLAGRYEDALKSAERGIQREEAGEDRVHLGGLQAMGAVAAWRSGQLERAAELARDAAVFSRETGLPIGGYVAAGVAAALDPRETPAARIRLEQEEGEMPWLAQVLAWWGLATASGLAEDHGRAMAAISPLEEDASLVEQVPLYAAVNESTPT